MAKRTTFAPMLAPSEDPMKYPLYWEQLRFPLLVSPKLDGIRCIVQNEICQSRKFIPLPSSQVQRLFWEFEYLDGELIVGNETDHDVFNRTQSYVMSEEKHADDMKFRVFDYANPGYKDDPFEERLGIAEDIISMLDNPLVTLVTQKWVKDIEELLRVEAEYLAMGYEGVMMKDPRGRYKWGRGTFREGLIYKLKRFQDDEGLLIGIEEGETNTNIDVRDALGNAKRSYAKEGMVGSSTAGTFIVNTRGEIVRVAKGCFKKDELKEIWDNQDKYLNKVYLKYRHFAKGAKDAPRFARAIGFRSIIDFETSDFFK